MKARFPNSREGTVKKEEEEENEEEENCLLGNKMSKLTIMKKRKNKRLKSSTKSNLAEKLIMITNLFLKKKLQ